jgi:hypothetical protein
VAYEAVFLRIEVVGDSHAVVVVGVNDEGRERQIARLPGAWAAHDISTITDPPVYLSPMGRVSPTGLLAIPSDRGDAPSMMHWEIFDLHEPQREPVVVSGIRQFIESMDSIWPGDAVWGPGERLAISWSEDPSIRSADDESGCRVNRRSCVTFVEGRSGASSTVIWPEGLELLPYWAADGSGVFVGGDSTDGRVLRPDGTMVAAPLADAAPSSCRTRDASGAELATEEHDLSDGTRSYTLVWLYPDGRREVVSSGAVSDRYACLAPDDSAMVYEHELIDPQSGATFHPKGRFAGWLGVTR